MDLLDTADPAWLDEFLAEDLKATGQQHATEATFPYNVSTPSYSNSPRVTPNDFAGAAQAHETRFTGAIENESLLKRFKFLKSRNKLSISKIAEILKIPKSALQRFSSGKDKNCSYIDRIKDWIYHPSNREGLRCFENNQRSEKMSLLNHSKEKQQELQNRRDSIRGPIKDSSFSYMHRDQPAAVSQPQPYYRTTVHPDRQNRQRIMSPYNMNNRSPYPEQAYGGVQRLSNQQSMTGFMSQQNNGATGRKWNHMQSLEVLSQMLKRDTNKLLHKGIDSAIQEYLDQSKALREKMKADPHTRENDYFYKKQGKLLLNRLTTICGDDVVNRATSVLSDLKSKREYKGNRVATTVELQKLATLTKTWNHACSCKVPECKFPNCTKIKPAVAHQLRLKDERRRQRNPNIGCTIRNCEHCMLYMKLKKFSTSTRNATGPAPQYTQTTSGPQSSRMGSQTNNKVYNEYTTRSFSPRHQSNAGIGEQRLMEYKPSYHNSYTSSSADRQRYSHSQSYSKQRQGHRQGSATSQMFNQQNNVTNNTQNVNNTNVSYNTYNIHTNPVVKTEGKVDAAAEDMSLVAELLDESRKHNVNINVNVSLYGNSNAQKRKQEPPVFKQEVKKPRQTSTEYQQQQQQQVPQIDKEQTSPPLKRGSSIFSTNPIDLEGLSPDVDDDLAALFPDTQTTANAHLSPSETENNNGRRVLCVVCHGKERDALFKPCNHCCACMNCALKLRTCPMCRSPVDSTSHIFLS